MKAKRANELGRAAYKRTAGPLNTGSLIGDIKKYGSYSEDGVEAGQNSIDRQKAVEQAQDGRQKVNKVARAKQLLKEKASKKKNTSPKQTEKQYEQEMMDTYGGSQTGKKYTSGKADNTKQKIRDKAAAKRKNEADISTHGGSTAPIPGADKVDKPTKWEALYGSKKSKK